MSQIRKGFIANNAIDGTKLKLLNNEAVRAANADGTDAELMKLDSSNVLQFLKLPQVSADPSAANDVARKSYVDSTVQSASSTLQSALDTEKNRIDAILSAATADADSFAEIVNLINSVDTTNDQAFASYVLSNDAALAQEAADRQSGDSDLQDAIDAEASARASAVSGEASARQAADQDLQDQIDALDSGSNAALAQEISDRQDADSDLQDAIDAEKARIDAILSASTADKDSFAEIVSLINSVDTENDTAFASYVLSNNAALAQEVSDRQAAVSAEASARQAADSTEQAAREAADSALDTRVDALEAVSRRKDKFTITLMDLMSGYVNLSAEAIADSEFVFVGSLYLHKDDHYTVSSVGGVTRLTWTGDLASSGATPLVSGDVVYVRYESSSSSGGTTPPGGGTTPPGGGTYTPPGGGTYTPPGGGTTPPGSSYSFPPTIGVTDNGDGTTTFSWAGASLPNNGVGTVYLVPSIGPMMYNDAGKISLGMGMTNSATTATPSAGNYVLRVYDMTGIIAEATSIEFSVGAPAVPPV